MSQQVETPGITGIHQSNSVKNKVSKELKEYYNLFEDGKDASFTTSQDQNRRQEQYQTLTQNFYDLVTDFYEYGWGESFHFAPRHSKETFDQSIARSEQYIALRLGLKPGMKVIDCGCGVGGPMREIARFSGSEITGINISDYQVDRANKLAAKYGMDSLCKVIKGDFMNIQQKNYFDGGYAIEATCHAPDKVACYRSIYESLKPGAYYCTYEWCVTDKYDPKNSEHVRIRKGIEIGNALPDTPHTSVVVNAFKEVGFEVLDTIDFGTPNKQNPVPWYDTLAGRMTIANFRFTRVGRWATHKMVSGLEYLKVAPEGSTDTSKMLNDTADALVEGGRTGIFTPSFFVLCRKPLNDKQ